MDQRGVLLREPAKGADANRRRPDLGGVSGR